ncbi:hypothetical protein HCJ66_12395 [Listeria sp. FSL L7-1582]|uniref:hypothetical protein n=1 Tax=Listeria portnoyi TaxID=2713504 RepID=UPI00164CFD7A|nr:hypothetical protein [Listeria portnoyi]MBC6310340.1 hypothetical protein [Listeria portnoyi]
MENKLASKALNLALIGTLSLGGFVGSTAILATSGSTAQAASLVTSQGKPVVTSPVVASQKVVTGVAQPNTTLNVWVNGQKVKSVITNAQGNWSITLDNALKVGDYLQAETIIGSQVINSDLLRATTAINDVKPKVTSPTAQFEQVVTGTAKPGATANVWVNGVLAKTTTADTQGNWFVILNAPLKTGDYLQVESFYGPALAKSDLLKIKVGTNTMVRPVILSGAVANSSVVSGFAASGTRIDVWVSGVLTKSTQAGTDNKWSVTLNKPLVAGQHLQAEGYLNGLNASSDLLIIK